jgi:hypothetical protein
MATVPVKEPPVVETVTAPIVLLPAALSVKLLGMVTAVIVTALTPERDNGSDRGEPTADASVATNNTSV